MGEFPTAEHRERYIADLAREVEGAERRVAELNDLPRVPDEVLAEAKQAVTNAYNELERARKTPKPKDAAAATPSDDGGDGGEEKPLDKMKLAELVAHAESVGIEGDDLDALKKPGTSKKAVIEAIQAKTGDA